MSARTFVRDAGGAARQLKRLFLRQAGSGAPIAARRIFVRDYFGVPRLVFNYGWAFSITPGQVVTNPSGFPIIVTGYEQGILGSGTGLTNNGMTLRSIIQQLPETPGSQNSSSIQILSPSDPGSNLFSAVAVSGGSTLLTSAAAYTYTGGVAIWGWTGVLLGLSYNVPTPVVLRA